MDKEISIGSLGIDALDANAVREIERRFVERLRQQQSEWVKRGMARQTAKGRHVHRVPVGYRRSWQNDRWEIEPDSVQAVHVHQAFLRAAEGNVSVRKLLEVMTGQGLANNDGKPMSASGFHSMLTNPFYTGTVWNGENLSKGLHAPIVSQETFEQVQQALRSNRRRTAE